MKTTIAQAKRQRLAQVKQTEKALFIAFSGVMAILLTALAVSGNLPLY